MPAATQTSYGCSMYDV